MKPDILTRYYYEIEKELGLKNFTAVLIEGSFGRHDWCEWSDLDVDYTTKNPVPLLEVVDFSTRELEVRRKVGKEYGYPNLARHWCTIFTREEQETYDTVFAVRIGVPRYLGETVRLLGKEETTVRFAPPEDIVVSLQEFQLHYENNLGRTDEIDGITSHKYARRAYREMRFYSSGERIPKTKEVDEAIKKYANDYLMFEEIKKYTQGLTSKQNSPQLIARRDLSHRLLFTMQKIRWEFISGMVNQDLFNWQSGQKKRHGFFPEQIKRLVREAGTALGTDDKEIITWLNNVQSRIGVEDLILFHQIHSNWMLKNAQKAIGFDYAN